MHDCLVYGRLIIREALRNGGRGWLHYDHLFRQQATLIPTLPWNTLHVSLLASTIVSQCPGSGTFCTICQGCDHLPHQCAMSYVQQLTRPEKKPIRTGMSSYKLHPSICWSWNDGQCTYPGPGPCFQQHICATCSSPLHKARDCKDTPSESC